MCRYIPVFLRTICQTIFIPVFQKLVNMTSYVVNNVSSHSVFNVQELGTMLLFV